MTRALAAVREGLRLHAGRAYVAGPRLADGLAAAERARRRELLVTVAHWGRQAGTADPTLSLGAAGALAAGAGGPWAQLSLKAPALGYDVAVIVERCRRAGVPAMFDAHGIGDSDATLAAALAAREAGAEAGIALAGRWARSAADAEAAIGGGVRVRIVKGQFAAPARDELDPTGGCLALVERLAGRARHVALGTHDPELARAGLRTLLASGTPCELEVLLGVPARAAVAEARAAGVPVRVYVPFGEPDVPYDPAQARREPRIALRLARDTVARPERALAAATPPRA
jgi:proline dehydrogenase